MQKGCWQYIIKARYPNGCVSEALINYCSQLPEPPTFPGDLNDGKITSNTSASQYLSVFPVPFNDQLNIQSTKERADLIISDMTGKILLQQTIGMGTTEIQTSDWASGIYFIQIRDTEGVLQQQKVLKP